MADDQAEDGAEEGAPKSKFKLIVAGVGVFAILAGGATYYMLFMRHKPDEKQLAEAAAAKPPSFLDVPDVLVNLAGIYGRNGDLPRSLDVLERLAVLEPSNPRISRDLAQLRSRVDSLN